jgi:hypothetical protein
VTGLFVYTFELMEVSEISGQTQELTKKREIVSARAIAEKHDPEGLRGVESTVSSFETKRETIQRDIDQAKEYLASKTSTVLFKIKRVLGVEGKRILTIQDKIEALKESQGELPDTSTLIESYYEKMQKLPLTNQEKRDLLKPEVLANLSMDEYITLWKRLNPHFLSHVTRQGFRDHSGMVYHTSGFQESAEGLLDILKDGKKLRPPLALQGLQERNETTVKELLEGYVLQAENEEGAKDRLDNFLNSHPAEAPKYPDITAVHFAGQTVADRLYGGEKNNEVFFIYPVDVIASQYNFAFNWVGGNFSKPTAPNEDQWNDIFVWPETLDHPGISLDAGIVFLPENTSVDPDTGSKYAMEVRVTDGEEKRVMVKDTVLADSFIEWAKNVNESSPVKQAFVEYKKVELYRHKESARRTCLSVFSEELQKVGFTAEAAWSLGYELFYDLHQRDSFSDPEILKSLTKESGADWKRAENTVSAKNYWENYFEKNPNLRPRHIQYYDGDPSMAVHKLQQENGIGGANTSEIDGPLLGFDDRHVELYSKIPDARMMRGYDELINLSHEIISEHYKDRQKQVL